MTATIHTTTSTPTWNIDIDVTPAVDAVRITSTTKRSLRKFVAYPALALAGLGLIGGLVAEPAAATTDTPAAVTANATAD